MADSRHGVDPREQHTPEKNSPARPFWLPADPDHPLLADAEEVLADLYQELVVEAADAQRRTTGMTIIQLTWLELATAHELGALEDDLFNTTPNRELLERYLQITKAKARANEFLLKLDRFQTAPQPSRKKTGPEQRTPETGDRRSPMAEPFDRRNEPELAPPRNKKERREKNSEEKERREKNHSERERGEKKSEPVHAAHATPDDPEWWDVVTTVCPEFASRFPDRTPPDPQGEHREKGGEKNRDTTRRERRRRKKRNRQRRKANRKSGRR